MLGKLLSVLAISSGLAFSSVSVNSASSTQHCITTFKNETSFYFKHYFAYGYAISNDSGNTFTSFIEYRNDTTFYYSYALNSFTNSGSTEGFVWGNGYYLDGSTPSYMQSCIFDHYDNTSINSVSYNNNVSQPQEVPSNLYNLVIDVNGSTNYLNGSINGYNIHAYIVNGCDNFNITLSRNSAIEVNKSIDYFTDTGTLINNSSVDTYINNRSNYIIDLNYTSYTFLYSPNTQIIVNLVDSRGYILYTLNDTAVSIYDDNGYLSFNALLSSSNYVFSNTTDSVYFSVRLINAIANTPGGNGGITETIDIPGLLFTVITMPFTFFTQGFNVDIYGFNIGTIIIIIIDLLILVFLIVNIVKVIK